MHYFFLLIQRLYYHILNYFKPKQYFKREKKINYIPYTHPNKKPPWVKEKVMYLKMHLPHDGCRKIAIAFNQQHIDESMTVSKSYVYRLLKENGYTIIQMRKEMKTKLPYHKGKNQLWQLDLTTIDKKQILGVIDSGTRALVTLKHLHTKSTINILITLLETIKLYGKPQSIRSDNEIVFTSKLMRATLWLLNIKKETTQIASPWQNGKIERLFGTMKHSFRDLVFPTSQALHDGLKEFRFFYNHVRLHQNLEYNTPSNAWEGKPISTSKTAREIVYFQGLCDNVAGYYYRE